MSNKELMQWLEREIKEGQEQGIKVDQLIQTLARMKAKSDLRVMNDWGKNRSAILVAEIDEGTELKLRTKMGIYYGSLCYRKWPNEFFHCGLQIKDDDWLPILEGDEVELI
jgi:hypothetical protein